MYICSSKTQKLDYKFTSSELSQGLAPLVGLTQVSALGHVTIPQPRELRLLGVTRLQSALFSQPGNPLSIGTHYCGSVTTKIRSAQNTPCKRPSDHKTIRRTRPPSSWITGGAKLPVERNVHIRIFQGPKKKETPRLTKDDLPVPEQPIPKHPSNPTSKQLDNRRCQTPSREED
ncbi:hypothetical protein GWI33_018491 [Rhynchophorus ferrugineus]|uniref:Uncharacterized protein n=1 Tax=Rhynchophorus ferrugineus TaxID=354439 RepID=A0A834HVY1_RHYFE|nr:hypothetical protein GWI33_018491 [Rhynchophorus ferrugineus]